MPLFSNNGYACIILLKIVVNVVQTFVTIVVIQNMFVVSINAMDAWLNNMSKLLFSKIAINFEHM